MSDSVVSWVKIGGVLKKSLVAKLAKAVEDSAIGSVTINNIEVALSALKIEKSIMHASHKLKINIVTDSGEDIKKFCRVHNLTYNYFSEAEDEYNAELCFWKPGMKEERCTYAMQSSEELVAANEITPLCNFMFEALKYGMHYALVDKRFKDLNFIKEHKSGLDIYNLLEKELKQVLWIHPVIPPFELI